MLLPEQINKFEDLVFAIKKEIGSYRAINFRDMDAQADLVFLNEVRKTANELINYCDDLEARRK